MLIPDEAGLRTADVYAEADRLGCGRGAGELEALGERLRAAAAAGGSPLDYADLLVNDLEQAAISLRPEIAEALEALERGRGAARRCSPAPVRPRSGSSTTSPPRTRRPRALPPRYANAIVTAPLRVRRG